MVQNCFLLEQIFKDQKKGSIKKLSRISTLLGEEERREDLMSKANMLIEQQKTFKMDFYHVG